MVYEGLLCRGLAICRMIFDFFVKCLTAQATKTVKLGPLVVPIQDQSNHNNEGKQAKENKNEEREELPLDEESSLETSLKIEEKIEPKVEIQVKRTPKKIVSINENAEVIYPGNDKRKRKRSFDKLPSFNEQKPIKSILKMGSNLTVKQQGVNGSFELNI